MADPKENPSGFTVKKKVDESWKDSAEKEKETVQPETTSASLAEPDFTSFLSTLGMQAFFALGELRDPDAPETKINLPQAKYLIDVIQILSDKTKGNLSEEEEGAIKELLYNLKLKFVEKAKQIP